MLLTSHQGPARKFPASAERITGAGMQGASSLTHTHSAALICRESCFTRSQFAGNWGIDGHWGKCRWCRGTELHCLRQRGRSLPAPSGRARDRSRSLGGSRAQDWGRAEPSRELGTGPNRTEARTQLRGPSPGVPSSITCGHLWPVVSIRGPGTDRLRSHPVSHS